MKDLKHFNRSIRGGKVQYELKGEHLFNVFILGDGRFGVLQTNASEKLLLTQAQTEELESLFADWREVRMRQEIRDELRDAISLANGRLST